MKGNKNILIFVACTVIIANTWPFTPLIRKVVDVGHYRYSNSNGSMTSTELMGRGFEMMNNRHINCLAARPELKDKQVYRLFSKNPFAFWRWRLYFFDERYKLPFKDWNEIRKVRERENVEQIEGCPIEF